MVNKVDILLPLQPKSKQSRSMERKVRVRFAPSPTGPLHIGGVRTALFNYLFAKKNGGDFLLRIEDTDQGRFVPGAEEYIIESLKWLGIMFDEGPGKEGAFAPYRQSERKDLYYPYALQLIESGHAYYAFDTPEELEDMRQRLIKSGNNAPAYNQITRTSMKNSLNLPADVVKAKLDAGEPYVIRFKIPRNEDVKLDDIIRGMVVVNTANLDDKVLFKSDGMPTYHLANIVDDYLMQITHVIRGEEWLPSAPLHVLLYQALGWEKEMPRFAHLPLILKPDGNGKLSKRDGDRLGFPVFPLEWKDQTSGEISSGYRERGYFKEAVINFLALLGWHPEENQEIFSLDELCAQFSLERVSKSGAKFDFEKATWFNQQYLRSKSNEDLAKEAKPYAEAHGYSVSDAYLASVCGLMKERASFASDLVNLGHFLFKAPEQFDENTLKKKIKPESKLHLSGLIELTERHGDNPAEMEKETKAWLEEQKIGFGAIMPIYRILLSGESAGPGIFDIVALLGKDESVLRLKNNFARFENLFS